MIKVYKSNIEFLNEHEGFLMEDEVRNNLMIGIAKRVEPDQGYFVMSQIDQDKLLGVIFGKNMVLAGNTLESPVYIQLVEHMKSVDYPGIIGPREVCEAYNDVYRSVYQEDMSVHMEQRIYSCSETTNCSNDVGVFRLATLEDIPILKHWGYDFDSMVFGTSSMEGIVESLHNKITNELLYVLEVEGNIVSMAAKSRPLKTCLTVSYVYTPLEERRKGYASRVVELLTDEVLKEYQYATLYTDLSNPTSNSIYQQIGYKKHCDSIMMMR